MRYTYDGHVDALYVYVNDHRPVQQIEVGDLTADIDSDGKLVGVEVLTTRLGWDPSEVIGRFELDDQVAADLRFLATISWADHIRVGASTSARSSGSSALVTTG